VPRSDNDPLAPGTPLMARARRGRIHAARCSAFPSFARH